MIDVIALDLGGVSPGRPISTLPRRPLLGVDPAAYEAAYWTGRVALDSGVPFADYWAPLLKSVG